MMHLTGISSGTQSARHMTGIANNGKSKTNSNVFTLNNQNKGEEEDNAVARLQSQINTLRERVQSIAENDALDAKTKGELTQSVREQMAELTQQLNQRRMEIRQQELEKEEEEQSAAKAPDSEETSKNTGRAKYDTFTKDDGLSSVSNAMLSAAKSVKLSEIQHGVAARKENQAGLLEKQAEQDTRLVRRTIPAGLMEKDRKNGAAIADTEETAPAADEIVFTKSKDEANIQDITDQLHGKSDSEAAEELRSRFPRDEKIQTLRFETIWEVSRGKAVEDKEKEAAGLKSDIRDIEKDQAKNLGDANRSINGADAAEEEDAGAFADPADLRAEAHVVKGIYSNTVSGKVAAARLSRAADDTVLDAYA